MTVWGLVLGCCLVNTPADASETVVTVTPGERPFSQIDRDIRAFMLRERRAQSDSERVAAVEDLCWLYEELKRDPRLGKSATLQGYQAKMNTFLRGVRDDVRRKLSMAARQRELEARRSERAGEVSGSDSDKGFPAGGLAAGSGLDGEVTDEAARELAGAAMSGQYPYLSASGGGATLVFWNAGGPAGEDGAGGGGVASYGDDLVALIQRTIQPEFWDVNGGPGSIYFYRPLNALVIRATSEVHHELSRLRH